MIRQIFSFWTEEKSLSAFLLLLLLQIFVFAPLTASGHFSLYLLNGFMGSLFLLAGLLTLAQGRLIRWIASGFIFAAIAVRWLVQTSPTHRLQVADSLLTICYAVCLTGFVLYQVFKEGPVSGHRVRGSIAAYLLLGYFFAAAYRLLYELIPNAFTISAALLEQGQNPSGIFMYFSLVTLTTVGFGDVSAVHPVARSLVTLEGVIGTLYPAILIARLVSLHIEQEKY